PRRASPAATPAAANTAPADSAPKKATAAAEDLPPEEPTPTAHMALAELDAEVAEIPDLEPFTFDTVGDGNEEDIITIGSPGDIPYAVASSGNLDSIFSHAMTDENWEKFIAADIT